MKLQKLTQRAVAEYLGISESGYGYYEQGRNEPSLESIKKLAAKYGVSVGYITGEDEKHNNKSFSTLSSKDEKDIAKRLEQIKHDLEHMDGLAFIGDPMSEEARDSLLDAMEFAFHQTQKINKKYTPKKYRKDPDVD